MISIYSKSLKYLTINVSAVVLYIFIFFPLYRVIGILAALLSIIMLVYYSFQFGSRYSLIVALLVFILNQILYWIVSYEFSLLERFFLLATSSFVTYFIGKAGDIHRSNKQLNNHMKSVNIQLINSNKNFEHFISIISHDLKAPIRKIYNFNQLLMGSINDKLTNEERSYFNHVIDGTARMNSMISDLVEYSKLGAIKQNHTKVDLNEIIFNIINFEISHLILERGAVVNIRCELPIIYGNFTQLHQLFQNLLSNAIKFVPKGQKPIVSISSKIEGSCVKVEFEDNGIGIDEFEARDMFLMFRRLSNASEFEGSGIGLAFAKKIVENHNGTIGVSINEIAGITMSVTFPRIQES